MEHELKVQHKPFPCTQCGACCRRAGDVPDFPEPTNEDGSCVHLTKDNGCGIYEDRPLVCRVNGFWEQHLSEQMSLAEWHRLNHEHCNKMIKEDGMDEGYLMTGNRTK